MGMPSISMCQASDCAFNENENCHAQAITVGGPEPCCDTFFDSQIKGGIAAAGSIGACKTTDCRYNASMECTAPEITIQPDHCNADCKSFEKK